MRSLTLAIFFSLTALLYLMYFPCTSALLSFLSSSRTSAHVTFFCNFFFMFCYSSFSHLFTSLLVLFYFYSFFASLFHAFVPSSSFSRTGIRPAVPVTIIVPPQPSLQHIAILRPWPSNPHQPWPIFILIPHLHINPLPSKHSRTHLCQAFDNIQPRI